MQFRKASIALSLFLVGAGAALFGGAIWLAVSLNERGLQSPIFTGPGYRITVLALAVGATVALIRSVPVTVAVWKLWGTHPDALVTLAWRQPSLTHDAPRIEVRGRTRVLRSGWFPVLIDTGGLSVYSPGLNPQRQLTVAWDRVGTIAPEDLQDGTSRHGVSVEVFDLPFPVVVTVGLPAIGVCVTHSEQATARILAEIERYRPTALDADPTVRSAELA